MKRSLVLTLCAAAVVALSVGKAQATYDVQINLRYDDPNNEAAGGTWQLLAKTDEAGGLAGVNVVLNDVTWASDADITNERAAEWIYESAAFGATPNINVVLGDDLLTIVNGIGTVGGAGDAGADDLANSLWNNSALLASGTFGATRPTMINQGANYFDGLNAAQEDVLGMASVRGDGVLSDGLSLGDVQRDFDVDSDDLGVLLNFFGAALGTQTWDTGDVEGSDGDVTSDDLGVLLNFFGTSQAPGPALSATASVPEPSSFVLLGLSALGVLGYRRR